LTPSNHCKSCDVAVRFAGLDIDVITELRRQTGEGTLTAAFADRVVWRRLAA
jgi:hypothetical protein